MAKEKAYCTAARKINLWQAKAKAHTTLGSTFFKTKNMPEERPLKNENIGLV